jgi:UMP-CMP kinase
VQAQLSGSKDGKLIDEFIREGKIVPVAISLGLLKKAMENTQDKVFLVDGFPRNADNVHGWNSLMADTAQVLGVLFFDCSRREQEKRLLSRGLTSGRTDDNIASAQKRFRTYETETLPVVELYKSSGLLRRICAEDDADSVYKATRACVESLLL